MRTQIYFIMPASRLFIRSHRCTDVFMALTRRHFASPVGEQDDLAPAGSLCICGNKITQILGKTKIN